MPGAGRDPRKANGHRRRLLFARVLAEESVCWLCGRPVDPSLRGVRVYDPSTGRRPLHPLSPTLDEVVPVSCGGDPLDRSNVRLAHLRCNEARGDRVPGSFAARPSAACPQPRASQDWAS